MKLKLILLSTLSLFGSFADASEITIPVEATEISVFTDHGGPSDEAIITLNKNGASLICGRDEHGSGVAYLGLGRDSSAYLIQLNMEKADCESQLAAVLAKVRSGQANAITVKTSNRKTIFLAVKK